jgi:hypothetical protein
VASGSTPARCSRATRTENSSESRPRPDLSRSIPARTRYGADSARAAVPRRGWRPRARHAPRLDRETVVMIFAVPGHLRPGCRRRKCDQSARRRSSSVRHRSRRGGRSRWRPLSSRLSRRYARQPRPGRYPGPAGTSAGSQPGLPAGEEQAYRSKRIHPSYRSGGTTVLSWPNQPNAAEPTVEQDRSGRGSIRSRPTWRETAEPSARARRTWPLRSRSRLPAPRHADARDPEVR